MQQGEGSVGTLSVEGSFRVATSCRPTSDRQLMSELVHSSCNSHTAAAISRLDSMHQSGRC